MTKYQNILSSSDPEKTSRNTIPCVYTIHKHIQLMLLLMCDESFMQPIYTSSLSHSLNMHVRKHLSITSKPEHQYTQLRWNEKILNYSPSTPSASLRITSCNREGFMHSNANRHTLQTNYNIVIKQ